MIILRLVHVALGVFWAGTLLFIVIFLEPSVRAVGPDGARVMQALQRRQLLNVLPVVAALTILSGLALYWEVSGGLTPGWVHSPVGVTLTIGAVAALIAFVIGVFVMRASTLRAGRLGAQLPQMPEGDERAKMMAQVDALRVRARTSARWVAAFLAVAVVTMAVARYA